MKLGFSLIELMLVLTLISILSLISYPLYNEHVMRVRRTYMMATLLDAAGRIEKYHAMYNTYEGANLGKLLIDRSRYENYYDVSLEPKENSFILKAAPIGKQVKDTSCGTLTLDQDGNRNASGSEGGGGCWL